MQDEGFQDYSEKYVHFIDFAVPEFLEILLKKLKNYTIIDLGCGDGRLLYSLYKTNLLEGAKKIVGVDISRKRIERLRKLLPFVDGIVSDVQSLNNIEDTSFDVVISSQVIEHVQDDKKMLKEVYRILKPYGYLYISTVIKKPYGMWIYWNNGFKLDPTHVREYKSAKEFLKLLRNNQFKILKWKKMSLSYPFIDLVLRLLNKKNFLRLSPEFYLKHKLLWKLRNSIKIKVIGYETIEVLGVKNGRTSFDYNTYLQL